MLVQRSGRIFRPGAGVWLLRRRCLVERKVSRCADGSQGSEVFESVAIVAYPWSRRSISLSSSIDTVSKQGHSLLAKGSHQRRALRMFHREEEPVSGVLRSRWAALPGLDELLKADVDIWEAGQPPRKQCIFAYTEPKRWRKIEPAAASAGDEGIEVS